MPGNGHALFDAADSEVDVDRHGDIAGQVEVVADDRGEPGQGKCELVGARPQIDDRVPPFAVGDDGPCPLNEYGTGRLDGDTGQHGIARVSNDTREGALGVRDGWEQQQAGRDERQPDRLEYSPHTFLQCP